VTVALVRLKADTTILALVRLTAFAKATAVKKPDTTSAGRAR
jgi:hypothetical protein